jgi:hypothetical protein
MLQKAGILLVAGLLGAASAVGIAACGEKRGTVKFETGTGETTATTSPTSTER